MTNPWLIEALRQNYIDYFQLFHGQHGIQVHVDHRAAWIVANGPPGNHILRTNLSEETAEEDIDALLTEISRHTKGARWLIFPEDRPSSLERRLGKLGFPSGTGDHWMFCRLQQVPIRPPTSRLRISRVQTRPELRSWWTASALGFGMTQRAAQPWYDAYRRHGFGRNAAVTNFIAKIEQKTVASATLFRAAGIAGIYDVSTLPAHRGLGYASALIRHMLEQARQSGLSHAGLQTSDAINLYMNLGFETGYQEKEFYWSASDSER